MPAVVITSAVRTAVGTARKGALANTPPEVLAATVLTLLLVHLLAEFERQMHADRDRDLLDQRRRDVRRRLEFRRCAANDAQQRKHDGCCGHGQLTPACLRHEHAIVSSRCKRHADGIPTPAASRAGQRSE